MLASRLLLSSAPRLLLSRLLLPSTPAPTPLSHFFSSDSQQLSPELKSRIDSLVSSSPVVVFMKGVPAQPKCGFSNAVVQIMRMHDVKFDSHDMLADEELREGKLLCQHNVEMGVSVCVIDIFFWIDGTLLLYPSILTVMSFQVMCMNFIQFR
jgi:hypothetical protein